MRLLLLTLTLLSTAHFVLGQDLQPPAKPNSVEYRIAPKLHHPLGSVVTAQGVVVEGEFKGYEGGPNLQVQRINGQATQENIRIVLAPYFTDFGEESSDGKSLPKLKYGQTYEFEGYESGSFVGRPAEALERAGILLQTTHHYFRHYYVVYKAEKVKRLTWSPADFLNREALLEGRAANRGQSAFIVTDDWRLLVDAQTPWPQELVDKTVEGWGVIQPGVEKNEYRLDRGTTRLVRLEDQIGRTVSLRGRAWNGNEHWWFDYRGTRLYVDGMAQLADWSFDRHGQAIVINGVLEEAMLPDLEQIYVKDTPDLRKQYIVRKPSWKPASPLLTPELGEKQLRD